MTKFIKWIIISGFCTLLVSCTVTNNLYVNNPAPLGKGVNEGYFGVGMGVQAKIDSVGKRDNKIHFSDKIANCPVGSLGVQYGISDKTDLRFALHFALIGAAGLRAGIQHSLFDTGSRINLAIGTDLGSALLGDGIGKSFASANGAVAADLFLPFSYTTRNKLVLVLTPRYSFNTIFVKEFMGEKNAKMFNFQYPAITLGIKNHYSYFEATVFLYDKNFIPQIGYVRIIDF